MKFYRADNCLRTITAPSGKEFTFDPCTISGGSWVGIYAPETAADQADLAAMAANPKKYAVVEITHSDFDKLSRAGAGKGMGSQQINIPTLTATTRLGLISETEPAAPSPVPSRDSVEEITVGPVTPAAPPVVKAGKKKSA